MKKYYLRMLLGGIGFFFSTPSLIKSHLSQEQQEVLIKQYTISDNDKNYSWLKENINSFFAQEYVRRVFLPLRKDLQSGVDGEIIKNLISQMQEWETHTQTYVEHPHGQCIFEIFNPWLFRNYKLILPAQATLTHRSQSEERNTYGSLWQHLSPLFYRDKINKLAERINERNKQRKIPVRVRINKVFLYKINPDAQENTLVNKDMTNYIVVEEYTHQPLKHFAIIDGKETLLSDEWEEGFYKEEIWEQEKNLVSELVQEIDTIQGPHTKEGLKRFDEIYKKIMDEKFFKITENPIMMLIELISLAGLWDILPKPDCGRSTKSAEAPYYTTGFRRFPFFFEFDEETKIITIVINTTVKPGFGGGDDSNVFHKNVKEFLGNGISNGLKHLRSLIKAN